MTRPDNSSGDPANDAPTDLLRAEDGMLSIVSVLTAFFFAVLASLLANIGAAINQKIEMQNAADAVAQSTAVQRARTLNTLTASNHLSGELMALVVLHESFGTESGLGDANTSDLDTELERLDADHDNPVWQVPAKAFGLQVFKPAIGEVKKKVQVRYALLDSYRSLKEFTIDIYRVKVLGEQLAALAELPFVGPVLYGVGSALYYGATAIEVMVRAEWTVLKGIEAFVRGTESVRKLIYKAVPDIHRFAQDMLEQMPTILTQTTRAIGGRHRVEATIFPDKPSLTFEPEQTPIDIDTTAILKNPESVSGKTPVFSRSQIVRASYPWVNYHRQPILSFTRWMVLSQFGKHYLKWSKAIALTRPAEYYQKDGGSPLYVIAGLDPLRKGEEPWTKDGREADKKFSTIGFAYRPSPKRWSAPLFPESNPGGTVTYGQAIMYNANAQHPGNRYPFQPEIGWDTLNWKPPVNQSRAAEWPAFSMSSRCPQIQLNWQAKLVPASRLPEAVREVKGPFSTVLRRIQPSGDLAFGH